MTAFHTRAAMVALLASTLGACAETPNYPIHESQAAEPPPVVHTYAPPPASPPQAGTSAARLESGEARFTPAAVQSDSLPPISTAPSTPAPPPPVSPSGSTAPPPIVDDSVSSNAPPVNRRPGAPLEPAAPPPAAPPSAAIAPVHTHARPTRPAAPPPEAHPLVAGRVEEINDTSHTVEVQKGDTVNTISDGMMTPKDALIKANRLKKPYELDVGQSLKVPVRKAYVVQSGDSLYGISRRFSTPVDVLSDLNRLDAKSHLRTGQKIALPQLSKDIGPLPRPGEARATESAASSARSEDRTPTPTETAPVQSALTASSSSRSDPYAEPSAPKPYSSVSPRAPARSYYSPTPPSAVEASPAPSDSQIQFAGRGRFIWPVRGDVLSGFGAKPGGQRNDGVDIGAPDHSAVRASASGDVVYAGDQIPGFGNLVLIKHEGGWVTAYAHLSLSEVKIRQHVAQGDEIGQVGQTGGVDRPELHFEIRYATSPHDKARPIDPSLVLTGQAGQ